MPDKETVRRELIPIISQLEKERNSLPKLTLNRNRSEIGRIKLSRKIALREAETVLTVCMATNENGKPMYGNESVRKAEVETRLAKDDEFCKWLRKDDSARNRIVRLRANESVNSATIKRLESMERIYLADYERED